MQQYVPDIAGLGLLFWLAGYLLALVLFFSPAAPAMGWILLIVMTPVTAAVTFWYFAKRQRPFPYFIKVGIGWTVIAIICDYFFIVVLFRATYYGADVFVYYAVTFLIPVLVGYYLTHRKPPESFPG